MSEEARELSRYGKSDHKYRTPHYPRSRHVVFTMEISSRDTNSPQSPRAVDELDEFYNYWLLGSSVCGGWGEGCHGIGGHKLIQARSVGVHLISSQGRCSVNLTYLFLVVLSHNLIRKSKQCYPSMSCLYSCWNLLTISG